MAQDPDIRLLTSPRIFLVGMAAFLALVGFVVLILYQQIALAFSANPGLNGLILGVLAIGALFTFRQVIRLFREIHWVNSLTGAQTGSAPTARLLAPMAAMLNAGADARLVDHHHSRDPRFDRHPARRRTELSRYLVGLLVCLGLLGTFRGLLETVHSIAGVIDSMKTRVDTVASMFDALKTGLSAPIAGMSVSFYVVAVRPRELARPRLSSTSRQGRRKIVSIPSSRNFSREPRSRPRHFVADDAEGADHSAERATGDRVPTGTPRRSRDARRRHPSSGRPHAHRTAANSRLGRRASRAARGHRQAPPPPAGRTWNALVPSSHERGEGEEELSHGAVALYAATRRVNIF